MKNIVLDQKRWFFFLVLILIGFAGSNVLLRSTPYGMGLINDTAAYVDGANNLLKGLGYVRTSGDGGFKLLRIIRRYFQFFFYLLVRLALRYFNQADF